MILISYRWRYFIDAEPSASSCRPPSGTGKLPPPSPGGLARRVVVAKHVVRLVNIFATTALVTTTPGGGGGNFPVSHTLVHPAARASSYGPDPHPGAELQLKPPQNCAHIQGIKISANNAFRYFAISETAPGISFRQCLGRDPNMGGRPKSARPFGVNLGESPKTLPKLNRPKWQNT